MMAPAKIPVELRALDDPRVRIFRLSSAIGPDRIALARDLPSSWGKQGQAQFCLPESDRRLSVTVEVASRELRFFHLEPKDRTDILAYIEDRLAPT